MVFCCCWLPLVLLISLFFFSFFLFFWLGNRVMDRSPIYFTGSPYSSGITPPPPHQKVFLSFFLGHSLICWCVRLITAAIFVHKTYFTLPHDGTKEKKTSFSFSNRLFVIGRWKFTEWNRKNCQCWAYQRQLLRNTQLDRPWRPDLFSSCIPFGHELLYAATTNIRGAYFTCIWFLRWNRKKNVSGGKNEIVDPGHLECPPLPVRTHKREQLSAEDHVRMW